MLWLLLIAAGMGHVVLYCAIPLFWPTAALMGCLAWLVAYLALLRRTNTSNSVKFVVRTLGALVVFSAASAIGAWRADATIKNLLPHSLDKQSIDAQFIVESMHQYSDDKALITAKILSAPNISEAPSIYDFTHAQVRLAWYSPPKLQLGQIWQARLTIRRPRGMVNPGGFDYSAWLIANGYQATGYRKGTEFAQLLAVQSLSAISQLRQNIESALSLQQSKPAIRFFKALLIGDRSGLNVADWRVLQATGTVHLMAISGLHVGLVAGLGFWVGASLVKFLMLLSLVGSGWWYRLTAPSFAILLCLGYSALAGFSIPTQRAFVAVCLLNAAWVVGLRFSRWYLLLAAVLLVTVSEPFAWLQSGFWLSFGAVVILLAKYDGSVGRHKNHSRLGRFCSRGQLVFAMQFLLALAMCLPLWLLGFPASVLSPIANVVAVPLVAGLFVPLLLLWVPFSHTQLGGPMLNFLAWAFDLLWRGLQWLAALPHAVFWPASSLQKFGLVVGVLVFILALLPRSVAMTAGAVSVLVLMLFGGQNKTNNFQMVALDVGQGLAVAIHQPEGTFLYDTGAAFSANFNAGEHIVAPYLRHAHADNLTLMVSHADADHRGGAIAILEQFSPSSVWYGEYFGGLPKVSQACTQGKSWHIGSAAYRVLWPPQALSFEVAPVGVESGNNRSCVLEVTYQGLKILLPGDIEKAVEQQLLRANILSPVDVLIAPHHGSNTSSSPDFLAALKPKHIIVSAGYKSRYGHPHQQVLARFGSSGAQIWNTAEQGAITVSVQDGRIKVDAQRAIAPKFWF